MPGKLAIDFGTSNTVVALWDEIERQGIPIHIPEYGRIEKQGEETISVIPSLIHYDEDNRSIWIGQQVIERGLRQSPRTFRWMKRYISHRSPTKVRIGDRDITPYTAGQDFLQSILLSAASQIDLQNEEVALSVPVEAFEHYESWLITVAENSRMPRLRLIDEPSAAALGYGAHIQPGSVYLLFDFGGGTMHAAIVLIEAEEQAVEGRRCRVLGKAGRDIGGTTIDQWIYQEVLRQNHRQDYSNDVRQVSTALLVECERVKEKLTYEEKVELVIPNEDSGTVFSAEFSRSSFEELLDDHNLFLEINQTLSAAINGASEHGYDESSIHAALMVGGSSQIPAVQKTLRQRFGRDRVHFNRPLDAVARGAAAFVSGVDFYDHIQHDYAIRYTDPQTGRYFFKKIVEKGTKYPSPGPITSLEIKSVREGQEQLGIDIFELSERHQRPTEKPVELVFDTTGAARIQALTYEEQEQRARFWMNEKNRTFLLANPPTRGREKRFEVEFYIDENKRLIITARDILTGEIVFQNHHVVKLT